MWKKGLSDSSFVRLSKTAQEERGWMEKAQEIEDNFNLAISQLSYTLELMRGFSGSELQQKEVRQIIKQIQTLIQEEYSTEGL